MMFEESLVFWTQQIYLFWDLMMCLTHLQHVLTKCEAASFRCHVICVRSLTTEYLAKQQNQPVRTYACLT